MNEGSAQKRSWFSKRRILAIASVPALYLLGYSISGVEGLEAVTAWLSVPLIIGLIYGFLKLLRFLSIIGGGGISFSTSCDEFIKPFIGRWLINREYTADNPGGSRIEEPSLLIITNDALSVVRNGVTRHFSTGRWKVEAGTNVSGSAFRIDFPDLYFKIFFSSDMLFPQAHVLVEYRLKSATSATLLEGTIIADQAANRLPLLPEEIRKSYLQIANAYRGDMSGWYVAILAKAAKCDGPITQQEIEVAENYIRTRNVASQPVLREIFREGKDDLIQAEWIVDTMYRIAGSQRQWLSRLRGELITGLSTLFCCDGPLHPKEEEFFRRVMLKAECSLGDIQNHISDMRNSGHQKQVPPPPPPPPPPKPPPSPSSSVHEAFKNLGVPFGSDYATCQKAYRALVLRCHPDKVAGIDLDPDFTKLANEKFNTYTNSWDIVQNYLRSPGDQRQ